MEEHPGRRDHRRRRCHLRPPHRQAGGRPSSRPASRTTSSSRRRPERSVVATRSCCRSPRRRRPRSSPTTRSRNSTRDYDVAVRRRPAHRWQARAARRLGVRQPFAGARARQPQGHAGSALRFEDRGGTKRGEPTAVPSPSAAEARSPTNRCPCRSRRRPGRSKRVGRREQPVDAAAERRAGRRRVPATWSTS